MSCEMEKDKLTGYLDGELDADEKREVESHLRTCPECVRDLDGLQVTSQALRALPRFPVPPSLARNVARELGVPAPVVSRRRRPWAEWALAAAAALFVAVHVTYLASLRSPEPAPSESSAKEPSADSARLAMKGKQNYPEEEKAGGADKEREMRDSSDGFAESKIQQPQKRDGGVLSGFAKDGIRTVYLTVSSKDVGEARFRVETALQRFGVMFARGREDRIDGQNSPLSVEMTEDQLVAFRNELEKSGDLLALAHRRRERQTPSPPEAKKDAQKRSDENGDAKGGRSHPDKTVSGGKALRKTPVEEPDRDREKPSDETKEADKRATGSGGPGKSGDKPEPRPMRGNGLPAKIRVVLTFEAVR